MICSISWTSPRTISTLPSGRTTQPVVERNRGGLADSYCPVPGANVAHGKMNFKSKSPAKMLLELLDDARNKGAGEFLLRSFQGTLSVLPVMGTEDGLCIWPGQYRTTLIPGEYRWYGNPGEGAGAVQEEGSAPVEAVVDGRTEFGILQKIYTRNSDETIEAAKQAAQELIREDGEPETEISLSLPDVPYVRKGDGIYCDRLELADGYYQVLSVNHDCDARTMTVKVKKANPPQASQTEQQAASSYDVGSQVTFLGGTHYVSSDAGARGYAVKGRGPAKITKIAEGKAHPYHLIHSDSSSNVYGWVDGGTFQ